jgi:acetyltransferase-like isoleucine patch superfamily enzyme
MKESIINILGYSGSILAIYFDILKEQGFQGTVNIVKNDDRTDQEAFDIGIPYRILSLSHFDPGIGGPFLLCSNKGKTRLFLFNLFSEKIPFLNDHLINFVHPASSISSSVIMGDGVVVEAASCVAPFARLGKGVFLSRSSNIGHHTTIGDWSAVNPGVTIAGRCKIGEQVTIGPGTTIFSNTVIGNNTVIGGGSVVTGNIPAGVLAWGNPCKVIKSL